MQKHLGWALTAAIAAGAAMQSAQAQQTITVDGSSTVFPVTEAVAEEFQKANSGARVTVGISGTGGGFKKFCRGELDISDASRPILKEEMEACRTASIKYVELPIAFDALAIAVSPENNVLKQITIAQLKAMFEPAAQGKITRWNQVDPSWPDAPLNLYGAGADSGTFDYFTEAVMGKAKASRGDYTASEDDNVLVQGVAGDKNAIGYIPFAYVHENPGKLKTIPVVNPKGQAVQPSMEAVIAGSYVPMSRPLFIYVSLAAMKKPEVRQFVEFYIENVKELALEVGYTPLPDAAYEVIAGRFEQAQTGTAFGGVPEVGLPIENILARKPIN